MQIIQEKFRKVWKQLITNMIIFYYNSISYIVF